VAGAFALVLYFPLLAVAAALVWARPVRALYAFVVGLALHNAVMAALFGLGVHGAALTVIQAWKETLLAVALARVGVDAWRERRVPFRPAVVDLLALAFALLVVVYGLLPQDALGGEADDEAVLLSVRHALLPVAAYVLGRSLELGAAELRRLAWTVLGTAAAVAAVGLVEEYTISVERWRSWDVPGYFREELGFDYKGPGRMPENFAFNTDEGIFRRLISTFLSPLASAFMFAVALLAAAAGSLRPRISAPLAALVAVGLLFTLSRSTLLALAGGFVVLAYACRRVWPLAAAAATLAVGIAFALSFTGFAPTTHFLPEELAEQERIAQERGGLSEDELSLREPSIRSHLTNLRDGLETVVRHPQGYGPGNAGAIAERTDTDSRAGESNYTELGVEVGIAGLALFVAWNIALLLALLRSARAGDPARRWAAAWLAASLATVLALGVQTDAFGVPWLAYCVWWLGGALAAPAAKVSRRVEQVAAPAS
jgi:O-Antigen ligase